MAEIRELVDGPAAVPDGPPPGAKELSRYIGQLANGLEEAYAAVYLQSDAAPIMVRAVRFTPSEQYASNARPGDTRVSRSPARVRVELGRIVAVVTGDGGACFQAVAAYLQALSDTRK
jgi:hypothetical protein